MKPDKPTQLEGPKPSPAARGSVMDRVPMKITAYFCCLCERVHRDKWPIFQEHYAANAKHYGWKPSPND